jgi:uncharacterized LabA/DUF88 family protein
MEPKKLAILIDADNVQASVIEGVLLEAAKLGDISVKRIYGDFSSQFSTQWKKVLNKCVITPVQQFAYTTGKNSSDIRLIIDAMDLLHKGDINGFCLVSSDSDFTGLVSRIREDGLCVYGFGEHKTPAAFRNACNEFIFTESLRPSGSSEDVGLSKKARTALKKAAMSADIADPSLVGLLGEEDRQHVIDILKEACEKTRDDTGWSNLADLGSHLSKNQPSFTPKAYGFNKLAKLVMALDDHFELENRTTNDCPVKVFYMRVK